MKLDCFYKSHNRGRKKREPEDVLVIDVGSSSRQVDGDVQHREPRSATTKPIPSGSSSTKSPSQYYPPPPPSSFNYNGSSSTSLTVPSQRMGLPSVPPSSSRSGSLHRNSNSHTLRNDSKPSTSNNNGYAFAGVGGSASSLIQLSSHRAPTLSPALPAIRSPPLSSPIVTSGPSSTALPSLSSNHAPIHHPRSPYSSHLSERSMEHSRHEDGDRRRSRDEEERSRDRRDREARDAEWQRSRGRDGDGASEHMDDLRFSFSPIDSLSNKHQQARPSSMAHYNGEHRSSDSFGSGFGVGLDNRGTSDIRNAERLGMNGSSGARTTTLPPILDLVDKEPRAGIRGLGDLLRRHGSIDDVDMEDYRFNVTRLRNDERGFRADEGGRPHTPEENQRKRRRLDEGSVSLGGAGSGRASTSIGGRAESKMTGLSDPVALGYMTEDKARELFALWKTELNSAAGILDNVLHTFEFVRVTSSFLFTACLCTASRFITFIDSEQYQADLLLHSRCLALSKDHIAAAFADAVSSLEVVQAMTILSMWKEPDDDKACFYFNRAVLLAKELDLGRIQPEGHPLTSSQQKWWSIRNRTWLCLFIVNTIFAMQFNQPILISQDDPVVSNCETWLKHSEQPEFDISMVASVQIRRKYLHYRDLLEASTGTGHGSRGKPLVLSVLARNMNKDLDYCTSYWAKEIKERRGPDAVVAKPFIWLGAIKLHLNALVTNHALKISVDERAKDTFGRGKGSLNSYYICMDAAFDILERIRSEVPLRQISFASDTWLHFTVYAAFYLHWVISNDGEEGLQPAEVDMCLSLIVGTADVLDKASLNPKDSPAMHARFLRRLAVAGRSHMESTHDLPSEALSPPAHGLGINQQAKPSAASAGASAFAQGDMQNLGAPGIDWDDSNTLWSSLGGAWWEHVLEDIAAVPRSNAAL